MCPTTIEEAVMFKPAKVQAKAQLKSIMDVDVMNFNDIQFIREFFPEVDVQVVRNTVVADDVMA